MPPPVASRYYYLKDYLGSIRTIVNGAGTVDSYKDYYPFGMVMEERSGTGTADKRFEFTGHEKDAQTDKLHAGARGYFPKGGKWEQVDPLAHEYPFVNPYSYAANNPVYFIDPNGKEVRIYTNEYDDNGKQKYITYVAGMKYKGDNEYVAKVIGRLNEIQSTKSGGVVVNELISTGNIYSISDRPIGDAPGAYNPSTRGLSLSSEMINDRDRNFDVSHELFHAYQHEIGFMKAGERTVNAEIGGYLFGEIVMRELGYEPWVFLPKGSEFSNAMMQLLDRGFSSDYYWRAIQTFQTQSAFNKQKRYDEFKVVHPALLPQPPIRRFLK